jgi:membrane protein implicated in regulation of membrane protease activity
VLLITAILLTIFVLHEPWSAVVVLLAAVGEAGEISFGIWYSRRRRAAVDRGGRIVGRTARVVEPCRPEGRVNLRGELWPAVCAEGVDAGERVRITGVSGLTLEVERVGRV